MKNIFLLLLISFTFSSAFGQEDVRATCKSSGLKIQALVKPFTAPVTFPNSGTNNVVAIIVVFSLPANGAPNTSNAPVAQSIACPPFPGISFINYPVQLVNDRFIYTYYNNPVGVATQTAWAVGVEKLLLELTFTTSVNGMFPRLDNMWNSGGGPNFFDYFYFEVNANQRSDTFGDPFYDGMEGTYGGVDQYVQAPSPLPIKLLSFNAEKSGDKNAHLTWSTASEINSNYFNVERSFDKQKWTAIGKVNAAGNSQIVQNYQYMDVGVYNGTASNLIVYYRLKMVDIDGSFEYSPIESVNFGKPSLATNTREFLVYPNPASEGIHVEWDANQVDQPTSLEFYDLSGKLMLVERVPDQTNQQYVDFTKTTMGSGLFLMRIMNGDQPIEYKQIVIGQH